MKNTMAFSFIVSALGTAFTLANTAPTVEVQSATMRQGTTLMDIVYRVNDPDDATVKVRALAFSDGIRSFDNVLRPSTFAEGTENNLGDSIASNTNHTLTWNVAADWNVDLGQVKFEVLAMDGRGLLEFDWITIPAAAGHPELTISKDTPSNNQLLDALFWQYASKDPKLSLENGVLRCSSGTFFFNGSILASGNTLANDTTPYLLREMDIDPSSKSEVDFAQTTARAGLSSTDQWHAVNRPYALSSYVKAWGDSNNGQSTVPAGLTDVTTIAAGYTSHLAIKSDGTVEGWNNNQAAPPVGLSDVTAITSGFGHCLALKSDGLVVGWGSNISGEASPPADLTNVTAIAAGTYHSLALKSDGTVVGWGNDSHGQTTPPAGLANVIAIDAGNRFSLALKSDGTVVSWGRHQSLVTPVAGLTNVTAISAGDIHCLALKSDGTVVAWGLDNQGQASVPPGLTDVVAVSAGFAHSLALKSDGTVVAWGLDDRGQSTTPAGLTNVKAIAAGQYSNVIIVGAPTPE